MLINVILIFWYIYHKYSTISEHIFTMIYGYNIIIHYYPDDYRNLHNGKHYYTLTGYGYELLLIL